MEKKNITFSDRLREVRKVLKLSQVDLSKKIGIKQSYYSAMESGKKGLSSNTIQLMISKLDISPLWLLSGEGNMFISKKSPLDSVTGNISKCDISHHQDSPLVSPIGIESDKSTDARTIEDELMFPNETIKSTSDLDRLYISNAFGAHSIFIMNILKANNLEDMNIQLGNLIDMCDFISHYVRHYLVNNRTADVYKKYFLKQITLEELLNAIKTVLMDEKELHNRLIPYIEAIDKVYNAVQSFDNEKDGILNLFMDRCNNSDEII